MGFPLASKCFALCQAQPWHGTRGQKHVMRAAPRPKCCGLPRHGCLATADAWWHSFSWVSECVFHLRADQHTHIHMHTYIDRRETPEVHSGLCLVLFSFCHQSKRATSRSFRHCNYAFSWLISWHVTVVSVVREAATISGVPGFFLDRSSREAEMKAKALSVSECTWMSEECHLLDELHGDAHRDGLRLPNIFRSKKVKPLSRIQTGPAYQVYHTARELLLEVLDRGAVRELIRRAAGVRAGSNRPSYSQSREQSAGLSEGQYAEALTWISIVLQSGLSAGENRSFGSELTLKLDGWQGVLKRNSFQTNLLSLTRLDDGDKLEVLSAFCCHITRRYQALYTPGHSLAVKKYRLSYQQSPCSLHLALLCDLSSGFICNMYLYCPEQLLKQSRKPVVEQVVGYLLRPFCSHRHSVQLDSSAWMEGRLTDILSSLGVNIIFVPTVKTPVTDPASPPPVIPHQQQSSEDSAPELVVHLQGWTGPALFPLSDLKGSAADVFLPGLWATLHIVCINTFVLHTQQNRGSGRQAHLAEFTRSLASQLAVDSSVTVPVLPQLNSTSYQETCFTHFSTQRFVQLKLTMAVTILEAWKNKTNLKKGRQVNGTVITFCHFQFNHFICICSWIQLNMTLQVPLQQTMKCDSAFSQDSTHLQAFN